MGFNRMQALAVSHRDGPMMVLAGPGSGKTLVITHRTKCLIEEYGVNPSNILVITFTKAAAMEMQGRFNNLIGNNCNYPVSFGTFHAVFFKMLKLAYNLSGNNILREEIKQQYIKEIIEKLQLEIDDIGDFVSGIIGEISAVKGDMVNIDHYYSKNCSEETFKDIFRMYNNKLEQAALIDFDDMLVKCYELLTERPDILALWQQKYKYILIDEFQDINTIQYEIIKLLARPTNNLFIVGDDDQSIYRFRGAKPEIMLNFDQDYPDAKQVVLDINYRSTKEIVASGLRVIKNNKKRFAKNIYTENDNGTAVEIKEFTNVDDENVHILEQIKYYQKQGYSYKDMAFLYRTNMGPRALVERLMEYNLPFRIKDALPNMYEHWIAKDILAYISIARGENTRANYLRIINKPKRYVGRDAFKRSNVYLDELRVIYSEKNWMIERIDKLEYDLGFIKNMTPYAAINYIRKGMGYDEYLVEYSDYRRMKVDDLYERLDELLESSKPYKTFEEWHQHIEEYGEKLKSQAQKRNENTNSIEIVTMHSAKGLEYPIVFIPDTNEGITPHSKSVLDEDIEEERRLFYVAMTRAKEKLHIYSVKERYNKPMSTSRFVGEMLVDIDELKEGCEIKHNKYGRGTVKKVHDGKMNIYFPKLRKELVFDMKYAVANRIIEICGINN